MPTIQTHIRIMPDSSPRPSEKRNRLEDYFKFGAFFAYFVRLFKRDKSASRNINLRMMHGINRISILMFLVALIVMITRWLTR